MGELFEMCEGAFAFKEFSPRQKLFVPLTAQHPWLPMAKGIIVRKVRRRRAKVLDDVRRLSTAQGTEVHEPSYIRSRCKLHKTKHRLDSVLPSIPRL